MFAGRSMLVKRAEPLPIECVARGYLSGSGWKDYQSTGQVCGIRLPAGLRESDRLPEPIFTPATKAETGHDINISEAEAATLVDPAVLARARELTIFLYAEGAAYAESRGIIVADTKFEFGLLPDDGRPAAERLILIDEVLTPDSSRFWPRDLYQPGRRAAQLRQAIRARLSRADQVEQAAAGPDAARRRRRRGRARSTSRRSRASPAGSSNDRRAPRASRRRNGRKRGSVRRRGPRVRKAVHLPRPRVAATAASPRPPTRSASIETRSPARWGRTRSRTAARAQALSPLPSPPLALSP